jgi:hypothetical protein
MHFCKYLECNIPNVNWLQIHFLTKTVQKNKCILLVQYVLLCLNGLQDYGTYISILLHSIKGVRVTIFG